MRSTTTSLAVLTGFFLTAQLAIAQPNNVILFVPDGLRALSVTPQSAPAMADIATDARRT